MGCSGAVGCCLPVFHCSPVFTYKLLRENCPVGQREKVYQIWGDHWALYAVLPILLSYFCDSGSCNLSSESLHLCENTHSLCVFLGGRVELNCCLLNGFLLFSCILCDFSCSLFLPPYILCLSLLFCAQLVLVFISALLPLISWNLNPLWTRKLEESYNPAFLGSSFPLRSAWWGRTEGRKSPCHIKTMD